MKKQLSISAAWALIARAYNRYNGEGLSERGFCRATTTLAGRGTISRPTQEKMYNQIQGALKDKGYAESFLWDYDAEGAAHRTLLAGFFAEATKDGASL